MSKLKILTVVLGWLVLVSLEPPHKFYVSNTTIHHNTMTQNMEVTIRLFTHDLEYALVGDAAPLHIGDPNEVSITDGLIRDYLRQHLVLNQNGVNVPMSYVGRETEFDRTFCYFEFSPQPAFFSMEIQNTLLLEAFPEQKNYLSLEMAGWKQSLVFTSTQTSQVILR